MDRRKFLATSAAVGTSISLSAFAQDSETATEVVINDMVIGSDAEDALTLVEYASFTCPHCGSFHEQVWPDLKANYIDTGKIKFVHREVMRNRADLWASLIARCDEGSKFFGITDMLFKDQKGWTQGSEADIADNLRKIGLLAGFDKTAVDACFSDRDFALALIEKTQADNEADAVQGTPTLILDGTTLERFDYETLSTAIDDALASRG